jgi:hypothetical protein
MDSGVARRPIATWTPIATRCSGPPRPDRGAMLDRIFET